MGRWEDVSMLPFRLPCSLLDFTAFCFFNSSVTMAASSLSNPTEVRYDPDQNGVRSILVNKLSTDAVMFSSCIFSANKDALLLTPLAFEAEKNEVQYCFICRVSRGSVYIEC